MSKYLLSTVAKYRVDTEEEAQQLIQEAKTSCLGELVKYDCVYKTQKSKGEIIQDWYEVSLSSKFNDPKEPIANVSVSYEV